MKNVDQCFYCKKDISTKLYSKECIAIYGMGVENRPTFLCIQCFHINAPKDLVAQVTKDNRKVNEQLVDEIIDLGNRLHTIEEQRRKELDEAWEKFDKQYSTTKLLPSFSTQFLMKLSPQAFGAKSEE